MDIGRIRDEYRKYIDGHRKEMEEGASVMKDDLDHSALLHRGEYTAMPLMIPRLYSMETKRLFEDIVETTYGILNKVINEYMNKEDYRRLFPFSKELEEMILDSKDAVSYLPLARFDIFYHEDTGEFYFCELNADGSSGMNADRLLDELMINNPAHQAMRYSYSMNTMELFDSWVDEFLCLYGKWSKKNGGYDGPNVVITDFLDMGRLREFEEFARRFQRKGISCEICDIRDFKYIDGVLYSKQGHRVDAVYRRAVTIDILEHMDEVKAFTQALRDKAVFAAGDFCTQIAHNKWLFYLLHTERTGSFLSEEENEFVKKHVPLTFPFDEKGLSEMQLDVGEIINNKDRYILKPQDGYGSRGVKAGVETPQEEWEAFAKSIYGEDYICQEFAKQYASYNIDFMFDEGKWKDYIHMAGLFCYNGKFAGVIARSAPAGGIIDFHRNERRQVTYFVEETENE